MVTRYWKNQTPDIMHIANQSFKHDTSQIVAAKIQHPYTSSSRVTHSMGSKHKVQGTL